MEQGPQGMAHCWFEPPLQSQISSWVPFVTLNPGSSRHRPDTGLTSIPFTASHCWLPPPLQVHSSTRVPLAVPAPVMSMHEPLILMVPSVWMVQFCAAVPLQSHISILVPLAPELELSSTHLAAWLPALTGPRGVAEPSAVAGRVRVGVAGPLDRLDRGPLLQALAGMAARARPDLERALLLCQVARLLPGGIGVEVVGVRQGQGARARAGRGALALPGGGGQ